MFASTIHHALTIYVKLKCSFWYHDPEASCPRRGSAVRIVKRTLNRPRPSHILPVPITVHRAVVQRLRWVGLKAASVLPHPSSRQPMATDLPTYSAISCLRYCRHVATSGTTDAFVQGDNSIIISGLGLKVLHVRQRINTYCGKETRPHRRQDIYTITCYGRQLGRGQ